MALRGAQNLSGEARSHVVKILGNDDLCSISSWMDELRSAQYHTGPLGSDPEALKFNAEFPRNGEWHYVDLPLGTMAYDPNGAFTSPHDVVHMLEEAVNVLEGGGDKRITQLPGAALGGAPRGRPAPAPARGERFLPSSTPTLPLSWSRIPSAAKGLPNDKGGNAGFFRPREI